MDSCCAGLRVWHCSRTRHGETISRGLGHSTRSRRTLQRGLRRGGSRALTGPWRGAARAEQWWATARLGSRTVALGTPRWWVRPHPIAAVLPSVAAAWQCNYGPHPFAAAARPRRGAVMAKTKDRGASVSPGGAAVLNDDIGEATRLELYRVQQIIRQGEQRAFDL